MRPVVSRVMGAVSHRADTLNNGKT